MQIKAVKVCFVQNGKQYTFNVDGIYVKLGQQVLVETSRGVELGTICSKVFNCDDNEFGEPMKKVLSIATEKDLAQKISNQKKATEIKRACEKHAKELKLDMKVTGAELNFEATKVLISFTADSRVDFRELVKVLAGRFKMRIELKQLDVREETKTLGGLGPCGRECCCSNFLQEATHTSIKMAKTQGLSLNPTSISGLCGKLKCCLAYESDYYAETYKIMPQINTEVETPDGKGLVVYNNMLKRIVSVKFILPDGSTNIKEYEVAKIKSLKRI
ncbi:MAG: hypothetical protein IJ318_03230 [Clostridia bacterium]|nr:hypothetical protein [Clostridia bacterium]